MIISNTNHIYESEARKALLKLYEDYCPVIGYKICSSDDQTTLVYVPKDKQQVEEDLMSSFQYKQVKCYIR